MSLTYVLQDNCKWVDGHGWHQNIVYRLQAFFLLQKINAWQGKQDDFLFQPALLGSLFAGYCMGIFSIFERFLGHHLLCP